jgi:hypothetical protein
LELRLSFLFCGGPHGCEIPWRWIVDRGSECSHDAQSKVRTAQRRVVDSVCIYGRAILDQRLPANQVGFSLLRACLGTLVPSGCIPWCMSISHQTHRLDWSVITNNLTLTVTSKLAEREKEKWYYRQKAPLVAIFLASCACIYSVPVNSKFDSAVCPACDFSKHALSIRST